MRKSTLILSLTAASIALIVSCSKKEGTAPAVPASYPAVAAAFGGKIDLAHLANYANQGRPAYIVKDNTGGNAISDGKATLGRVLFYDKALSINNSVACASCHKQAFAFSDTALVSAGVEGGSTGRHSMRLVNARYAREAKFFWNERAATLEQQTTMPIQDHAEMGFSGTAGRPGIATLLAKLSAIDYYQELFRFVYGDASVTEARLQECLAQFVRSIQSFDSKYDAGRAQVPNDGAPFPNFTAQENQGKQLFLQPPQFTGSNRSGGGLGCNGCHNAPEFDIDPATRNNGIIGVIGGAGLDLGNTRAPSLRDLLRPGGGGNGPMMHTAVFTSIQQVLGHYGNINVAPGNNNLDPRLMPGGNGQRLNLTAAEVNAVTAFLQTLSGTALYTDAKWSDPFR
ncbi:cytochrome-c peroxidase [Flaviaesturariibacter aridisoli]|uniref:Cytochrome-c peroxidase n=1 Tax=Flaviaesturariibacter aridisoli TaxID=2545761 RepID=A0A4R4E5J1_9BACT|nr:cytochrome c peroxidase [Flaviaesturariibacter aridisoli]TCZ74906.1 cytochrome-c peroxidase [Flaviaesturariibacter aridisoli]